MNPRARVWLMQEPHEAHRVVAGLKGFAWEIRHYLRTLPDLSTHPWDGFDEAKRTVEKLVSGE